MTVDELEAYIDRIKSKKTGTELERTMNESYPNMPKSIDEFYQEILKTLDFYGITLSEKEIGKLFKITSFNIGLMVGERSKQ